MKKYLILSALPMLMQIAICKAALPQSQIKPNHYWQDSLAQYTGKYQTVQNGQTQYADVTVENGKLVAKSSTGQVLVLEHISGDNFIVSKQGATVKFIRDAANKVSQIAVMGNIAWTRVDAKASATANNQPAASADYLGKYQITMNGQTLYLEISLKDGQLWCTQLWDGAGSAIDQIAGDDFMVRALTIKMKFKRGGDNKVTQLLLNNTDVFTKVKS